MQAPEPKLIEPAPAGTHVGVLIRIIELGTQDNTFQGETRQQHQIMLCWELPNKLNSQGQPFVVSKTLNFSTNEKATYRHWAEAMLGRPFTKPELFGKNRFNVKNLLGESCLLQIEQTENTEGKIGAKIKNAMALPEGMAEPPVANEFVLLSLEAAEFDATVFENLSPWAKEKILKSPEYANLLVARRNQGQPPIEEPKKLTAEERRELIDDEIPF